MNAFEREVKTLSFSNEGLDRGVVEESMYPWDKTVAAWDQQGLKTGFLDQVHFATLPTDNLYAYNAPYEPWENYYNTMMTEPVFRHESQFAFDPVKRICFRIPFISFEEEIREETDSYIIKRDRDGWVRKYPKGEGLVEDIRPVVTDEEDWEKPCTHVHDESCGANGENCQHQHDATCGYAAAKTEWTTTLPTAVGSYPVRVKLADSKNLVLKTGENAYTTGTLTISARSSGGGSGGSGNKTETTTNPDGSTTTTVTRPDGSTTETTKNPDGSTEVVDTKKDGTVTTTTTDKDGNKTAVTENTDGTTETVITNTNGTSSTTKTDADSKTETVVKLPASIVADAADKGETVALPMPEVVATSDSASAPTVTVDLPSGKSVKVEIPVSGVTPGTVAVIVGKDGEETIAMTSIPTENGVVVALADGDTVKVVENSKDFADVPDSYWGADAVDFATSRELFNGTSETAFTPDGAMNRAMIVTVLARYEGVDTSVGDTWYDAGRDWAMEAGISDGTDMDGTLTREQLATMLYRYAQSKGYDVSIGEETNILSYVDALDISEYAMPAMQWACGAGIMEGADGRLSPQDEATRVQVATMLMRFIQNIA